MIRLRNLGFPALLGALAFGLWAAGTDVSKLSTYGYVGRSGDVALVVGADAARYRGGEKFIPLVIWLGHSGPRTLRAERGSFTLRDPAGQVQPLATLEAMTAGYGPTLLSTDYGYISHLPDYGSPVFLACQAIRRVAFFPNLSGPPGVLYDHVNLPVYTYFTTLLYFSNPAGKAQGNYTLIFDDPSTKTHIEIPFPIAWEK